ncbi:hypothetical protein BC830DRAFT_1078704 [Chytriomyces sp. MP71]|nr:hypothetical protein BC830DRAFT_1078704 [Chytriomyces sp. MP71]
MALHSKERGGTLSNEEAAAIWDSFIANQKTCQECKHPIVEKPISGIFQATPQRPNAALEYNKQGCQRLYMENNAVYQATIRHAIRAASTPVAIHPDLLEDVVTFARTNWIVISPPDVKKTIDTFWTRAVENPDRDTRLNRQRAAVSFSSKQHFYRLWWVSGDIRNLSGIKGNWEENNSEFLLTLDRIVPGAKWGIFYSVMGLFSRGGKGVNAWIQSRICETCKCGGGGGGCCGNSPNVMRFCWKTEAF